MSVKETLDSGQFPLTTWLIKSSYLLSYRPGLQNIHNYFKDELLVNHKVYNSIKKNLEDILTVSKIVFKLSTQYRCIEDHTDFEMCKNWR